MSGARRAGRVDIAAVGLWKTFVNFFVSENFFGGRMLALLNISNFALISELKVEFERGLNLLTGETGSGKSIIVDALGVLIGDRFASEMIRAGERNAFVEGLFMLGAHAQAAAILEEAGVSSNAG